jgi:hypothetical protein
VNWYFMSVMSTTCILQHAVVCWVTTRRTICCTMRLMMLCDVLDYVIDAMVFWFDGMML